jgi:beta-lactamase regulating signal transducer with metallopeptidase domain
MGFAFAAIGFVVANTAISLLTVLVWRVARPWLRRAGPLFLVRMLPAIGSASLVLGLVLPAYWSFEPRATVERAGPALGIFVVLAGILVGAGLYRTIVSWRDTRRLECRWKAEAVATPSLAIPVLAYRIPSEMPLAALVGVVRPRLFVSDQFLDALSAGERQAVLDHEAAHLLSLDNLKRTVMRLAPDWLSFSSSGREIETAWAIAAEEAADDHAAGPERACALDLAGALLKALRLAPMRFAEASNFCDGATIAHRVARLLQDPPARRRPERSLAQRFVWILTLLSAATLLASPALRAAYTMTEAASRLLQ